MFLSPYDTTALRKLQLDKLIRTIETARIQGAIRFDVAAAPKTLVVLEKSPATLDIPQFNQTIVLADGTSVIDLRPYRSEVMRHLELSRTIPIGPAAVLVDQSRLQTIWQLAEHERLRLASLTELPIFVYANWLGEAVAQLTQVEDHYLKDIIAMAGWFWTCQFYDVVAIDESLAYRYASKIARTNFGNVDSIATMIQDVGQLKDLADFVKAVQDMPTARTNMLNVPLIITTLSNSWFGSSGAKEQAAAAIEHPPTFIAILANAVQGGMYRKARFVDIAKRLDSRGRFENFINTYKNLLNSAT